MLFFAQSSNFTLLMKQFEGKTVIITGASSGIGSACVREFAKAGANVVLAARSEAKMSEIASGLSSRHLIVPTDVAVEQDCQNLIQRSLDEFGSVDVLINNAGISMRALFKDLEIDVLRRLMEVNFWGTVYCTKYALPALLESGGSVVGVSSIAGYRGLPGRTGYSASKFAMQGFLESLRTEHLYDPLHVMVVCPGFTATNIRKTSLKADGSSQGDSPRNESSMMSSEEVAAHIAKGVSGKKRTVVLTRQGKLTVLLNKWFPGFMDKQVFKHMAKEPDSPFGKKP